MTSLVRYLVLVVCLLSLAFAAPVTAARATDMGARDCPTTARSGAGPMADGEMDRNKAQSCAHDTCCGYQMVANFGVADLATPAAPRTAAVAAVVKHLTSYTQDTLLDPPRT